MGSSGKPQFLFWRSPLVLFALLGGLVFMLAVGYFFYGLEPQARTGQPRAFQIAKGERFADIGSRLSREGLLKSISVFKFYALISGKAQKFQPGVYELSPSMSTPEILRTLTASGKNEIAVTIPEGYAFLDIALLLAESGVLSEGELRKIRLEDVGEEYPFLRDAGGFEGFLFPDTYRFERGSSALSVLRRFLDTFKEKAWPMLEGKEDWYKRLILASYLEREVPEFQDRRVVAGVLLKRAKIGMLLQVDATLVYAKCNGKFLGCSNSTLTRDDRGIASPYNTYERPGWSPTPISNPGESAIKASVSPEESPYLYYLSAKKTGETIFSRTLEEHNRNRARHL
ncbi:MAG: endolytic transglycosylase MltG [Nanoarchaeota archaeon]|nr:endolytic transglycosylase MltG [Nanoarchaeota archaeon]